MEFVFVTGSDEKACEAAAILGDGVERRSLELAEIQASTLEEIARAKVRAAFAAIGRACAVEDSGLEIAAWGGLPGPYVKWFERRMGLARLCRGVDPFPDRAAEAVCAVAFSDGAREFAVTGRLRGSIALEPRGIGGFGWDAIFVPERETRTFAEMTPAEKNAISHRRLAWLALKATLAGQSAPVSSS